MTRWRWVGLGVALTVLVLGCGCCGWIGYVNTVDAVAAEQPYLDRLAPIASALAAGRAPDPTTIETLAADRVSRAYLIDTLDAYGRFDLLPAAYASTTSCAEADLARWLTYPTELDRAPAEMELAARGYVDDPVHGPLVYLAFRFTAPSGHWASADGWMFGISGPWPPEGAPRRPDLMALATYSELDPYTDEAFRALVASLHEARVSHAPVSVRVEIVPLR